MDLVEYAKETGQLDNLIIIMLWHDLSITEVAKRCGVSRQHVYNVIDRSKQLLLKYNLLDKALKQE